VPERRQAGKRDDRVSLAPLDPETALRALLGVEPEPESKSEDQQQNSEDEQR
jgi:hypothetical protein